jgi:thiopurine S-methyltransferase
MPTLNDKYWSERYQSKSDSWDIGYAAPALQSILDEEKDKTIKILIPGCGNAYEAAYAFDHGFTNTSIIDWAKEPLDTFKNRYPNFPINQIIQANFFEHEAKYDLIIEQTFFCAIEPSLRTTYVKKCAELLNDGGKIKGLLFNCVFEFDGPPFGGSAHEYNELFEPYFIIEKLAVCEQSITPRKGNELQFEFIKKPTL